MGKASVLGVLILSLAGMSALPAVPAAAASQATTVVPGGTRTVEAAPRVPAGATRAGAVRPSTEISGDLVLKPRDNAAVTRFIAAVTDKNSPLFHRYLPAGAYASRFGPSQSTISAARSVLKADGLQVTGVSADHLLIHFRGDAAAIGTAFHTGLENYRLRDGFTGRTTTSAVRLPATIAGSVAAVLGLDDLVQEQPAGIVRAPASDRGKIRSAATAKISYPAGAPKPCKAATAAATGFGGLTDDQIAHAYGAFGLYDSGDFGAGQHIAIYELEPFERSDVETFDTCFFGAKAAAQMLSRLHVYSVDGGQPAGSGSGEAILDVEDVSAIAPGANIDVYVGVSPGADGTIYDPVDGYAAIIDADTDQVISTSWGLCEQAVQAGQPGLQAAENLLFEQAAAQGQSVFAAAGDNGSDDCNTFETSTPVAGQNPLSVDDPGSQPYVVSVGGTTIDDAATQPPAEHVWNDGADGGGGGGGISQSWVMPSWQQASTLPGIAQPGGATYAAANQVEDQFGYQPDFCQGTVAGATSSTPCRLVPDVSAQADEFTGAITIYQAAFGGWSTIGGTSSATPIWAATLALVNASPMCASTHGVGFASPLLYGVASDAGAYRASFNDITTGDNDIYGLDNGLVYNAAKGYDLASGLGSPRLTGPGGSAGLAYYLCSYGAATTRPLVDAVAPDEGGVSGGTSVTITGTGFESGGVPDVAAVQIGSARLTSGDIDVVSPTEITATMPPASEANPPSAPSPQDGAGPADVIVTLTDDQSSRPSPESVFEYTDTTSGNAVPSVTGVIPYGGSESDPGPVTILGSGFTGTTSVTFGGVGAATFTVDGPNRITATPPAYSPGTACAPLPATAVYFGENAANDICQVQVQVGNSAGRSSLGQILPPDEGAVALNSLGVLVPPANCGCEIAQSPTEYDYVPAPTITSVSTSTAGAANLASENGGTIVTVHGTGLNPLTIDWANFGPASQEASQNTSFVFMTGTEMQIMAPPEPLTTGPVTVPFSVRTLGGQSAATTVSYAGIPRVTSVVNTRHHKTLDGIYGAPDTGGTAIKIGGKGFTDQLSVVEFTDTQSPFSVGTQYTFNVASDSSLSTQTVQQNPALVAVQLCTVTGCSRVRKADKLYLYPPGNPHVASVSPTSGKAAGGTKVTIDGNNLGCAISVFFGKAKARSFTQTQALLDCGSTVTLTATSPKGKAHAKVAVSVETVESYFANAGHGTSSAKFTYK
ncbi:MAG TPA: IPT/TIG domain-containing protein [Streptosporangiaceae bacterium]|nr:IPT/TIG domain-containing protein [Streptosporangiaceae bacterium]